MVLGVGLAAVAAAGAGAQAPTPPTAPAEGAGLLPGLDARLVGVGLEYATSSGDLTALRAAQVRLDALVAEQAALHVRQLELEQRLTFLTNAQQKAARDLIAAELNLDRLTALVYMKGNTGWSTTPFLAIEDAFAAERVDQIGTTLTAELVAAQERARILRKQASAFAAKVATQRVEADTRLLQVEVVELPGAQREVQALSVSAAATLAGASVNGLGIPLATIDAYLRAEASLARERPECALQWWMLAGIGRVESNHGRYGGAQPGLRGNVTPRIVGIPLDGSPGIAAIHDTDDGTWDGDATWDRAVGPMQFIPSTWRRYAVDGNGDRASDPNNLYDAATGAGRYLCSAAGHLGNDGSLTRAYLAYNHSDVYAARVLELARGYQALGLPPPVA
ncbi:MAG: lytic transglycosylase domain-containing protein [Acidimicrobiia bacterium]